MNKVKNKWSTSERLKTIPLKTMGVVIVCLFFMTGLSANAATISGTVTDAGTSTALAGVTINVNPGGLTTTTDGDGDYTIPVNPGCYQIVAHPGDVDHIISARRHTYVEGSNVATIDFALETGAITLSGNIQAGGYGLSGVEINYYSRALANGQGTSTVSNGGYTLYNLPPGEGRLQVRPWGTGWAFTGRHVDLFDPPLDENFNLVPGACINGRVVDENGDGVDNVPVGYSSDYYATWAIGFSDVNGDFNICSLPPGIGRVEADPQNVPPGFSNSVTRMIFLSQGKTKYIGRMTVKQGALVRGTVEDRSGTNFTGLEVESDGVNFQSKSNICNGFFELALPEGIHQIYLHASGDGPVSFVANPVEVEVLDVNNPVDVTQEMTVYSAEDPESATLTGEVDDSANPNPTGKFYIAVFAAGVLDNLSFEDMPNVHDIQGIRLDGFGPFTLFPMPPGSFDVVLFLDNETPDDPGSVTLLGKQSGVTVSEGVSTILADFEYNAQGSPQVEGYIDDINGNFVLGASVLITDSSGDFAAFAETDENGHYVIYNLPAGSYDVQATHPDYSDMPVTDIVSINKDNTAVPQLIFNAPIHIYDIPLDYVSVMNVHEPGDIFATYLEVIIGNGFAGTLPEDIDSITVVGPSGTVATYPDDIEWIYDPQLRLFFIAIPVPPPPGEYTFTVIADGGASTGIASDNQGTNYSIPIPDTGTFLPLESATISSKTPYTFSWGEVTPPPEIPTLYYRLEINENYIDEDNIGNRVYASGRVADMLSHTVPNDKLNPGQTYAWRVRALDSSNWVAVQNRAHSEWLTFTVERDPKRLRQFNVMSFNGDLDVQFSVLPGFRNKLLSATVSIPNSNRTDVYPEYTFDLDNDSLLWDTECRYLDMWFHNFGPVQVGDYGDYTLTLTFSDGAEEVYTDTLEEVIPPLPVPAVTNTDVTINPDGSIDVTWLHNTTENYYYQVRVRDDDDKEYCRVGSSFNALDAHLSAGDLRCLKKGETYRLLVRVFDLNYNACVTTEVSGPYDPSSLIHTDFSGVYDWRGELTFGFDTRPGSRDQVDSVVVTGPDSIEYTFGLEADWSPLSTETRLEMDMWWYPDSGLSSGFSITPGEYTFTIDFEDKTEQYTKFLNVTSVAQVDSSTMSENIKDSGVITFSWDLPGVLNQEYYVAIRSENGDKEYYRSSRLNDATEITASFWDLRGLEHGRTYQWFVRSSVSGYNTLKQSESLFFVYNPFDAEGDGLFDLYDLDDDNDGLLDIVETNTGTYNGPTDTGTDPLNPDHDGDGICDGAEVIIYGTNPLIPNIDTDNDGLSDEDEGDWGTSPTNPDSDGDGLSDGEEVGVYSTDPTDDDSDNDTVLDGDDAFPMDAAESLDSDGDGIGDNADNCPSDYNEMVPYNTGDSDGECATSIPALVVDGSWQPDYDCDGKGDGKGDACDEDADADGYISPYFPNGNDCNDLNPLVFPGDGICMAEGLKPKAPRNEIPDADDDKVYDTEDNCPSVANAGQSDSDSDDYGDLCDTCPDLSNPDQKVPVWYKDLDGDGYSDGETLTHCDPPSSYIEASALTGLGDCDDSNESINPGAGEVLNNRLDDDCDPETPDVVPEYSIVYEMEGHNYDEWLPVDGETVVVNFRVIDADGNLVQNSGFDFSVPVPPEAENPTSHPGTCTNDPGGTEPDFEPVFGLNQMMLTSNDYGGSITIRANVEGVPVPLQKDITFPKDTDQDGLPDFWEKQYGDLDPAADIDGDGLTNFEEYRGVFWGRLNSVGPNSVYQTVAYIPDNIVRHIRTDPTRRDLFVKYIGFDAAHPFAIGKAYMNAGIDVYALDAEEVTPQVFSDDYNIDVVMVTLADTTFGLESGHIIKRGVMDYTFATLGLSSFGNIDVYGSNCIIYKNPIDYYFKDRPYIDWTTFDGTNMRDQNAWGAKNGMLDMMPNVEDKDDDGKKDGGEDKSGNGVLDGDHVVRAPAGSADPWEFNHDLSPFNINNDSVPMVELPVGDVNYETTKAQVLKHVITHEIGHNVGVDIHTEDPLCVMYKYSSDWLRDDHFSDAAQNLIMIHNQ